MGIVDRISARILTVKKCRCFAHDNCFNGVRNVLEKLGVDWEEELLKDKDTTKDRITAFSISMMDKVVFHQDRFEIIVDARGFRPEEIKCTITSRSVEVNARKEDQFENAQKRVSLTRQYLLPQNVSPEQGQCCLSSDGILLITAPWMK